MRQNASSNVPCAGEIVTKWARWRFDTRENGGLCPPVAGRLADDALPVRSPCAVALPTADPVAPLATNVEQDGAGLIASLRA